MRKRRPELDEIVPVGVTDHSGNVKAQLTLGFRLCGVLPAPPSQTGGAVLIVTALGGKIILKYHPCKVKAAYHEFHIMQFAAHRLKQRAAVATALAQRTEPLGYHLLQRAAVG